jgi:hypothetical protein
MTDSNSPSHWDVLASMLGAKPPQEEVSRQPSPPAAKQPSAPKTPARASQPPKPPQTSSWDVLATNLGISQVAPPELPKTPPKPVTAPSDVVTPPLPEPGRRSATQPETPEESPNFFDERFDFEEPFDLLEASEAPVVPSAETPTEPTEPTEKRPRRRRRRRRGRGGERQDSQEKNMPAVSDSATDVMSTPAESDSEHEPSADKTEVTDQEHIGDESEKPRPKRRRSRRGKKRRDTEAIPAAADEHSSSHAKTPPSKSHDADEFEEEMPFDDSIPLGEGEERPARLGFRGIPTWDEAVGMLIEKNLEARAKRPVAPQHHGRGGRGSRDNRGGRGGKRPAS